jgi:hypothetical protein
MMICSPFAKKHQAKVKSPERRAAERPGSSDQVFYPLSFDEWEGILTLGAALHWFGADVKIARFSEIDNRGGKDSQNRAGEESAWKRHGPRAWI